MKECSDGRTNGMTCMVVKPNWFSLFVLKRGLNEQLLKTSHADVLSSREKKTQKNPVRPSVVPFPPSALYVRGLKPSESLKSQSF